MSSCGGGCELAVTTNFAASYYCLRITRPMWLECNFTRIMAGRDRAELAFGPRAFVLRFPAAHLPAFKKEAI